MTDAGSVAFGIDTVGFIQQVQDASSQPLVVTPTDSDAITDAGTVLVGLSQTATQQSLFIDSNAIMILPSASETLTEAGTCALVFAQSQIYGLPDTGTVTFVITPDFKTGGSGVQFFSVVAGTGATERIIESGTFVFALSDIAASTTAVEISGATPATLDAGRRLRIKGNAARLHANQTQNPWRRDRSMR
jgi:hypothetical protein